MRKFIKQIACAMTLALTVGALSVAAPAQAASGVTLARKDKVLYVGGAKGYSVLEDGTKKASVVKATYALKKQVKGLKKGQIVRFSSANEAVATVLPKKGTITSVAPGKVVIKVEVKEKDKKTKKYKVVDTLSFTVSVRKNNATAPVITNAPKGSVGIGKEVYKMEATWGDKTATDKKGWKVVEGSDIASITADGKITTTKAGTFKVQAYTYQSADYTGATAASEIIEMKAAVDVAEAKASAINKIELTFNADAEKLDLGKNDFTVYAKESNYNRSYPVKEVEVDGNKVTLTTYSNFKADVEYVVKYNKTKTELGFTLTSLGKTDVKQLALSSSEFKMKYDKTAEAFTLGVQLLNEDGVDLYESYKSSVTVKRKSGDVSVVEGNKIQFKEIDKTGVVTVTYKTTYTDEDKKTQTYTLTEDFTVSSVRKEAAPFVLHEWYILNKNEAEDGSESGQEIPVNVKDAKFVVKMKDLDNDDEDKNISTIGDKDSDAKDLSLKSQDEKILKIAEDGVTLIPVKEGTVVVFIQNNAYDKEFVDSFEVEVTKKVDDNKLPVAMEKPKYTATVTANKDTLNLDKSDKLKFNDSVEIAVAVDRTVGTTRTNAGGIEVTLTAAGMPDLRGTTDSTGKVEFVVSKGNVKISNSVGVPYQVSMKKNGVTIEPTTAVVGPTIKVVDNADGDVAKYVGFTENKNYTVGDDVDILIVGKNASGFVVEKVSAVLSVSKGAASEAAAKASSSNTYFFYPKTEGVGIVSLDDVIIKLDNQTLELGGGYMTKVSGDSGTVAPITDTQVENLTLTGNKVITETDLYYYDRKYEYVTEEGLAAALATFEVKTSLTDTTKAPKLVTKVDDYKLNEDYVIDGYRIKIINLRYTVGTGTVQSTLPVNETVIVKK